MENRSDFTWEKFKETEYFTKLDNFYKSIAVDVKKMNKKEKCVIVFVSRRALCVYLLAKQMKMITDEMFKDVPVFSDRYVEKRLDSDFWKDNIVFLIDDSVNTGNTILKSIDLIKEKTGCKKIKPYVFLANMVQKHEDANVKLDKAGVIRQNKVEQNYILKMCSIESILFNKYGVPYTAELPVIVGKGDKEDERWIQFSKDEWSEFLERLPSEWQYYECNQVGYLQNDTSCGCITLQNSILKQKYKNLIQNLTIRVQITQGEGKVKIIFVPFAILRSVSFNELKNICIRNSEYYIESFDQAGEKNYESKVFNFMYRATVFLLSCYVGAEFSEYLSTIGKENEIDLELSKLSYQSDFIDKCKNMILHKNEMVKYILNFLMGDDIEIVKRNSDEFFFNNNPLRVYSYSKAYNFILDIKSALNARSSRDSSVSIESMEEYFKKCFLDENVEQLNGDFSSCICGLLNQGVLVNRIYYSDGIVHRGFGFGENAEVFYSVSAKVFYAAVSKYFDIIGARYEEMYQFFLIHLYSIFSKQNLFGPFISEEEFDFYSRYYEDAYKNKCKIKDKRFILDDKTTPYFIQIVTDYVEKLDYGK